MPLVEPASIKVFGILHLVFGGIGIFGFLAAGAQLAFKDAIMKASAAGDPEMFEMQKQINDATFAPTMIGLVIGLVVTVMIMRAGLKLVKKTKDAVAASTLYSYVSIAAKILAIILAVTMTLPAVNEVFDKMAASGASSPAFAAMNTTMKTTMAISGIGTPMLMSIYPILSLVMLRKKPILDFLAQYGK